MRADALRRAQEGLLRLHWRGGRRAGGFRRTDSASSSGMPGMAVRTRRDSHRHGCVSCRQWRAPWHAVETGIAPNIAACMYKDIGRRLCGLRLFFSVTIVRCCGLGLGTVRYVRYVPRVRKGWVLWMTNQKHRAHANLWCSFRSLRAWVLSSACLGLATTLDGPCHEEST